MRSRKACPGGARVTIVSPERLAAWRMGRLVARQADYMLTCKLVRLGAVQVSLVRAAPSKRRCPARRGTPVESRRGHHRCPASPVEPQRHQGSPAAAVAYAHEEDQIHTYAARTMGDDAQKNVEFTNMWGAPALPCDMPDDILKDAIQAFREEPTLRRGQVLRRRGRGQRRGTHKKKFDEKWSLLARRRRPDGAFARREAALLLLQGRQPRG